MFKNYLITSIRNFFRQKQNSLINLGGLALGITVSLFILLYIKAEISYEKSYPDHRLIFRLASKNWAKSSPPVCEEIRKYFPQIKNGGRLTHFQGYTNVLVIDQQHFPVRNGYFADQFIIEIFSRKVISGDPNHSLTRPFTLVLTESLAKTLFGERDPVGKSVKFAVGKIEEAPLFEITAVIEDFPINSHMKIDYLVSMPTFYKYLPEEWTQSRTWMVMYTYLLFNNQADVEAVKSRLYDFQVHYLVNDNFKEEIIQTSGNYFELHTIGDIHLTSHREQEMGANSDISYIYIFGGLALLIILVASANFINIYITQSLKRTKEVGIRKMTGAYKGQLIRQFIMEAYLYAAMASLIALILCGLLLPIFNDITNLNFTLEQLLSRDHLTMLLILVLIVGIVSGGYPAFFISGFKIADVVKINQLPRSSLSLARKVLIVFQFMIAIFMVISSIVIYQQLKYLRNKDLGFDKENIVAVYSYGDFSDQMLSNRSFIYNELLSHPGIISVGFTSNLMGNIPSIEYLLADGRENNLNTQKLMRFFRSDEGFIPTMNIKLITGRNFDPVIDSSAAFIINEAAVRTLELDEPVGTLATNTAFGTRGQIVGVMKDFNFASLHQEIEPLVLTYRPDQATTMLVKLLDDQISQALGHIEKTVKEVAPGTLFHYDFIDANLKQLYTSEDKMGLIFKIFSLLAILISCMGLYGIAAYTSELRTKEIGIRKAFGASSIRILFLLCRSYLLLIVIALVIAIPLANYFITEWLRTFAYHLEINWLIFLFSGFLVLFTALIAVSTRSIRAANINPALSLRFE